MAMPLGLLKEPKETMDGQCLVALNLPSRFTKHLTSCVDTFFFPGQLRTEPMFVSEQKHKYEFET